MFRIEIKRVTGLLMAFALFTSTGLAQEKMEYPKSKKVDQVDTYFGTPVLDPYRWLETNVRNSAEVKDWVDAQNKLTSSVIANLPWCSYLFPRSQPAAVSL